MTSLAWTFAQLIFHDEPFLTALISARDTVLSGTPQEMGGFVWATAKLSYKD